MRLKLLVAGLMMVAQVHAGPLPSAEAPADDGPWVVRAYFDSRSQFDLAASQSEPWQVDHRLGYAVFEVADRADYDRLSALGLRLAVDPEQTEVLRHPLGDLRSIPGFGCYRTVEESFASMDQLTVDHPTLASVIDIGDSWNKINHPGTGYDLRVLKLSNSAIAGPKPALFIMGAVHAREYTTAETVLRFAEGLLARYADDADARWMLDHHELYILVHSNPDGRKMAEAGDLWRKNLNENYCGATSSSRGADLNRNFPFEWGAHGGSSGDPCSGTFRGANPGAEPESAAIITFLRNLFPAARPPDLVTPAPSDTSGAFVDVHSYGRLVMWAWGFTPSGAPNGEAMTALGRRMAWFNGYRPQQANELYTTDGGTKDFAYGELGIPGMSYEIGTAFFQSCASFETAELDNNLRSLEYLLRTVRRPYLEPEGPSIEQPMTTLIEVGEPVQLAGWANDAAFNQGNGISAIQPVAGIDVYLDQLPWLPGSTPDAGASALDGSFDASVEGWQAELPSVGLAPGLHTAYLRARDSGGQGPTYARHVRVAAAGSTAQVAGVLRDARSGEPLQVNARVRLDEYGSFTDPAGGSAFALRADGGSHELQASAAGYVPVSMMVDLSVPATTTQDLILEPLCTILSDEASSLDNFSAQAPWGLDSNRFISAPSAFADSPSGDYGPNVNASLTMAPRDFSADQNLKLSFQSFCDTELGFDYGRVEISTNGSNWSEVWRCDGAPLWQAVEVDLSALDQQPNAQIRFRFSSDTGVQASGWNIDDVRIEGTGGTCDAQFEAIFDDGFE